ncbi:MAG: RNA polymerase sigma factor region1.1 domain-containing protein, partial [Clostridium sp.]|nr:RNA polymerase sigma factor region1.1 domain-containing protein [Clostridium sp.]
MKEQKEKNTIDKSKVKKTQGEKMEFVKSLIEKGKKKGSLTYKEIMDELQNIELTPEQIEK